MIGMALGPLLLGISREYYGEYRSGCKVMAVASFLLALSMLMLYIPFTPVKRARRREAVEAVGGAAVKGKIRMHTSQEN